METVTEIDAHDASHISAYTQPTIQQTVPANPAKQRDPWLALVPIVVLAAVSGLAYDFGFVRPYALDGYYMVPLLDLAKINEFTAPAANSWALTWIVLFACYYLAFRICPAATHVSPVFRRAALALICGAAAIYSINLVNMYPVGAADLFDQIFRARITSHYGLNPFFTLPSSLSDDPFFPYVAWRTDGSPYGPLWELLSGGTSWIAGDSLWNNLILFKLLVMLAYGVNVALTYGILRVTKPDWALRGTLFFAWNPLVLFEVAGNGHNDSILLTCLLAAVYLFVLAQRSAVIPALMAGALTKFVPILLVPVAAAAIWRDRTPFHQGRIVETHNPNTNLHGSQPPTKMRARPSILSSFDAFSNLALGGVLAIGLAVALYAPFWEGWDTVGALGRQSLFTASIPKVVLDILENDFALSSATAQGLVRNAALGLVALVALACSLRIFLMGNATNKEERQALIGRTLGAFYEIIFVYLAFATLWFQPWYLLWLVALTAPVARFTNANRTILFCIGGVANYFVWDFIWPWNHTDIRNVHISAALAVYTLPLFYTLYVLLRPLYGRISRGQASEAEYHEPPMTNHQPLTTDSQIIIRNS